MGSGSFKIGDILVGAGSPCFVIAEIGANHNQDFDTARRLIDACVDAGAQAVKFQSFTVSNWISKDFVSFPTVSSEENLSELLRNAELSYDLYARIAAYCRERDVICFSTPSHIEDVDRLEALDAPAYKFGAVQITDLPTIRHAALLGKPIILSAGASNLSEIVQAVECVVEAGNEQIALLQCTSIYPCRDYRLINLNVMKSFMATFDFPIGFSDHTLDPVLMPAAAVAMGAKIVEKHVTLDRTMKGPDHPFALETDEFARMVQSVRGVEQALGSSFRQMLDEEKELARLGRRSLVAKRDLRAGDVIQREDLTIKRPGTGIEPRFLDVVIGRKAIADIEADRVITWEMV